MLLNVRSRSKLKIISSRRQINFALFARGSRLIVLDEQNDIKKILIDLQSAETISLLKGQAAVRISNIIRGRAAVVLSNKELAKVVPGCILVASMTKPDYIGAMKKAAAIITDEGGLISHAAIVARELRKPCVVGTKTATKVLKDGDLVEVDVDKGIVKILKRRE